MYNISEGSKYFNQLILKYKNGGGGGSRIRLTRFSANRDISGIPFDFNSLRPFHTIFNEQNKFNQFNHNQNFLHQIYTKA
jgi:hypothetical protein